MGQNAQTVDSQKQYPHLVLSVNVHLPKSKRARALAHFLN